MALGNTYNNNKNKYSPTTYSGYRLRNMEHTAEPSAVSFTFWNSLLKISIGPKGENGEPDYENGISVYLNHTKARILYEEICLFLQDPIAFNNRGVCTGKETQGIIIISNGSEFGFESPCLVIKKVSNDGTTESSFAYMFKTDYHYAIRNLQDSDNNHEQAVYQNLEIEQLMTVLKSYYEAMTSALAYSVIDQMKFDQSRMNTKMEMIATKLGVQFQKGGNGGGNRQPQQEGFFNRQARERNSGGGNNNYQTASVDDMEGFFNGGEE